LSSTDPSKEGQWKIIGPRFKYNPVHIALLHTGQVLTFGGSGNDPDKLNNWNKPEIYEPDYTGQTDGKVFEITNNGIKGDIFCAGHAFLPDGRLFVTGGTYKYDGLAGLLPPFSGLEHAYIFDPKDLSWTRIQNMEHGRWYPTCVMLADGSIATFAGLTKHFPWLILKHHEIYSKTKGWKKMDGADKWLPLYPRIHLLPNGKLFYAGSYNTHMTFPFSLNTFHIATFNPSEKKWKELKHSPKKLHRQEGSTVLLPLLPEENYTAKVILIGGGDTFAKNATETAEIIDFSESVPQYRLVSQSMNNKRYYVYPVILPDQNILVVGGKSTYGHGSHSHEHTEDKHGDMTPIHDSVLETELFVTKQRTWKILAKMQVARLYHANAILLQDGRVMAVGSNPDRKCEEKRIEIFSPPYLFHGKRPAIQNCPKDVNYGSTFEIGSDDVDAIKSVCFIRPSSTTHCLNPEQRYVGLEFEKKDSKLSIKVPTNRNVLPPGYYMLFILNHEDIPSVGKFVRVSKFSKNICVT